jgi:hypothetical protein
MNSFASNLFPVRRKTPPGRMIPLRVIGSNFCVDNGNFSENLKSDFPGSPSRAFSMRYDTSLHFVESFLFPCREVILFIEFCSTVHSTGKHKPATRPKHSQNSGSLPPPLHPKHRPRRQVRIMCRWQRVLFGVI